MNDQEKPKYLDASLSFEERAEDLVARMTVDEKIAQTLYFAPAVERLGVPDYNWWNECLHGVARAGVATVFPQAIGMAAAFDETALRETASIIADEGRAKFHEFDRRGDHGIYKGLTFWTPNINIFRDPRWGRGQETYGEDPYLTGRLGVAFVQGLQGDDPRYLKSVATPKHYAVHSGPESLRHEFDAVVSEKDLRETYLPAFRDCVKAGAFSVMGAYNRTNGHPCCAHPVLIGRILREEWGFKGYVVSDCGAIQDINLHHKVTAGFAESAALAVKEGCDLNCGKVYQHLKEAVDRGLITEEEITVSVERLFLARFKLGLFDPPDQVPYASTPYSLNDCTAHHQAAREMAAESMVLLKNRGGLLPLHPDLKSIAVIGPNADSLDVLIGNYFGTPSEYYTPLRGIREAVSGSTRVFYAEGCHLWKTQNEFWGGLPDKGFAEALAAAERAEAIVLCLGLSPSLEGEEGAAANSDGGGDRKSLDLPGMQQKLLETVCALGKPTVLVLFSGSPLAVNWAEENVPAIIEAWYPGQEGGRALADILFGRRSPAGRLPITFPRSIDQLPEFTDYAMKGRTYRYMEEEPLYPFGFGLSYCEFEYSNLVMSDAAVTAGRDIEVSVKVANEGPMNGEEVVQVYLTDLEASVAVPRSQLVAFRRIAVKKGESEDVAFTISARQMACIRGDGKAVLEPGRFRLSIGGSQPDPRSTALCGRKPLEVEFEVTGNDLPMDY